MRELKYIASGEFQRVLQGVADPLRRAEIFAAFCRLNALYMISRAGFGHLGQTLGGLDVLSALHLSALGPDEPGAGDMLYIASDHDVPGLYAVLTGLGRLEYKLLHRLGRLGGLSVWPEPGLAAGIMGGGSLDMGLGQARGILRARRMEGQSGRIFMLIPEEQLDAGRFWESLAAMAGEDCGGLTLIVLRSQGPEGALLGGNDARALEFRFEAFDIDPQRVDGHRMAALLELFASPYPLGTRPRVVIAGNVEGKGVSFLESAGLSGPEELHSLRDAPPSPEAYAEAFGELSAHANALLAKAGMSGLELESMPRPGLEQGLKPQDLVAAYGKALLELAADNPDLLVLDSDVMAAHGLSAFEREYPERFISCGPDERDMVSMAGGLAQAGKLPICHGQASRLSARANEQIHDNAARHRRLLYTALRAGLLPGGAAMDRQAVRDIAALSGIPGLIMFQPADAAETGLGLRYCLQELPGGVYFRLSGAAQAIPYRLPIGYKPALGVGVELRHGRDAVIIAHGPVMLSQAYLAAEHLQKEGGPSLGVLNLPWLNRVDPEWLLGALAGFSRVFTLDDHQISGGQGGVIAAALAESGRDAPPLTRLGVDQLPAWGQDEEVLAFHRLDAGGLAREIAGIMASGE